MRDQYRFSSSWTVAAMTAALRPETNIVASALSSPPILLRVLDFTVALRFPDGPDAAHESGEARSLRKRTSPSLRTGSHERASMPFRSKRSCRTCRCRKCCTTMGYETIGRVSLPVLNQFTAFSTHFDDYRLMDDHNDFAGMVREIEFPEGSSGVLFPESRRNALPVMLKDLPKISGVHGVFKLEVGALDASEKTSQPAMFSAIDNGAPAQPAGALRGVHRRVDRHA